jgi:hypothetical protein
MVGGALAIAAASQIDLALLTLVRVSLSAEERLTRSPRFFEAPLTDDLGRGLLYVEVHASSVSAPGHVLCVRRHA